jgi:hypothetical protein
VHLQYSAPKPHQGSWPAILADLDSLTESEIEQDGRRFLIRSAPKPAASLALSAAGVVLPATVQTLADTWPHLRTVVPRRDSVDGSRCISMS